MRRQEVLEQLAAHIGALSYPHPLRVAVDGIDTAGKTTLASELVRPLQARGRTVIRASIDSFHRPRNERYQRGADSSEGYYWDSFDYPALRDALLRPLGPLGSRRYRSSVFDVYSDRPRIGEEELAPENAVLVMDGVFLLRPELDDMWEYRVWVDIPFDVMLERAMQRDVALLGSVAGVKARYQTRYIPGQNLYLALTHPQERADAIVGNADPANPLLCFPRLR